MGLFIVCVLMGLTMMAATAVALHREEDQRHQAGSLPAGR